MDTDKSAIDPHTYDYLAHIDRLDVQLHQDAKGRESASCIDPSTGFRTTCDLRKAFVMLTLVGRRDADYTAIL